MNRKQRFLVAGCVLISLVAFSFAMVWQCRAKEDANRLASLYRELPTRSDGNMQKKYDLEAIAILENKKIPYRYPFIAGYAFGALALAIALCPMPSGLKKAGAS